MTRVYNFLLYRNGVVINHYLSIKKSLFRDGVDGSGISCAILKFIYDPFKVWKK